MDVDVDDDDEEDEGGARTQIQVNHVVLMRTLVTMQIIGRGYVVSEKNMRIVEFLERAMDRLARRRLCDKPVHGYEKGVFSFPIGRLVKAVRSGCCCRRDDNDGGAPAAAAAAAVQKSTDGEGSLAGSSSSSMSRDDKYSAKWLYELDAYDPMARSFVAVNIIDDTSKQSDRLKYIMRSRYMDGQFVSFIAQRFRTDRQADADGNGDGEIPSTIVRPSRMIVVHRHPVSLTTIGAGAGSGSSSSKNGNTSVNQNIVIRHSLIAAYEAPMGLIPTETNPPTPVIETFSMYELIPNPALHKLVPKHVILPENVARRVLARLGITRDKLPIIFVDDIQAKYLGAAKGQIVAITRNYNEFYLRVCISDISDLASF